MGEMRSPRIGSEYEHIETGERVTVVSHMFDQDPGDEQADSAPQTPFVVEDEDGEETGFEHPAQFYETYIQV